MQWYCRNSIHAPSHFCSKSIYICKWGYHIFAYVMYVMVYLYSFTNCFNMIPTWMMVAIMSYTNIFSKESLYFSMYSNDSNDKLKCNLIKYTWLRNGYTCRNYNISQPYCCEKILTSRLHREKIIHQKVAQEKKVKVLVLRLISSSLLFIRCYKASPSLALPVHS